MIVSTGMATLAEARAAVKAIKKAGNRQIIVLHCTTNYPCPLNEVNLRAMLTMRKKLPVLVGYSDHTVGIPAPIMAAALGACLIEKHFTLNKNMPGPDHKASLEPTEFKALVRAIRQVNLILGSPVKKPTRSENKLTKIARKSLVSLVAINKGDKLTMKNIGIKRPGTGLAPRLLNKVLGKKVNRNIEKDRLIRLSDLK
jgi:sialic acid synthase SpsE